MLRKLTKGHSAGSGSARNGIALSVIGPDVRIVGNILTQGEMQIDGQVEGDITCQTLVVGEGARILGEVTAENVRVHGELTGKINANSVMIAKSAHVVGDIIHESLEIEAGGHLEGHLVHRTGSSPQATEPMRAIAAPPGKTDAAPAQFEAAQ